MKRIAALILALGFLASCTSEPIQDLEYIESPAAASSSLPRLVTDQNDKVYLSWVEKSTNKVSILKYAKLQDDQWGDPQQIASGDDWFVNWADFPSLSVNEEHMAAHWLQKSDLGTYDYDVRVSFSSNYGDSWGESIIPHKDGVAAEHGFVSMLPMDDGHTFITWLDGRNTKGGHGGDHGSGGGAMTLRAGIFDARGNTIQEWELDNRICDCCQTGAAMTANGPVVVYRDRSETEIRDMSIVRYVDGQWTTPQSIAVELWEIPGCPVNGPAITASGNDVAVAWFTAKGGTPQVKLAVSNDGGATFSEPTMVSEGITNGRVGITKLDDGNIALSWMETRDDMAQVMVAKYNKAGMFMKKMEVAQTSGERASGFPVITSSGNTVYMAWTEVGEENQVKTAKINL